METPANNKNSKYIAIIIGFFVVFSIFAVVSGMISDDKKPLSYENMTVEQRLENDVSVLRRGLSEYEIEQIEIDYSKAVIKVYTDKTGTTKQLNKFAKKMKESVNTTLWNEMESLTLGEKKYNIFVYGENKRLID